MDVSIDREKNNLNAGTEPFMLRKKTLLIIRHVRKGKKSIFGREGKAERDEKGGLSKNLRIRGR